MADTIRTSSYLRASVFQDGQAPGSITEQDERDFVVSAEAWIGPAFVTLTDGATVTWATAGAPVNHAKVTLGGNRTLDITGEVAGASGTLVVTQDGTGSRTLTLPAGSKAPGGAFTLSTAAGSIDVLAWVFDGSVFYWTIGKAFA
jgi:plastocyanin